MKRKSKIIIRSTSNEGIDAMKLKAELSAIGRRTVNNNRVDAFPFTTHGLL